MPDLTESAPTGGQMGKISSLPTEISTGAAGDSLPENLVGNAALPTGGQRAKTSTAHQKKARIFSIATGRKINKLALLPTGGQQQSKNDAKSRAKPARKMALPTGGQTEKPPRIPGYEFRLSGSGWIRWAVTTWYENGQRKRRRSDCKYFSREAIQLLREIQNERKKAS
ncbi:MAG: hypothetical protein ACO24O_04410 [Arenimonas sp.]